ncbi:MAG: mechanosensitive ion channel [Paludibacter sp.]|nr:mechanosensitive ion channel [Paludibacter sp.]
MDQYISNDITRILIATISFIGILVIVFFIYRKLFRLLKKRTIKTTRKSDNFIIELFRIPALSIIYWVLLSLFTHIFLRQFPFYAYWLHINTLLLIFSIAWICIQFTRAGEYYLQSHFDIGVSDNLHARKRLTQLKVFKGITNSIIIVLAIAISLLTFKEVRTLGLSLLTSAGIFGIIIGFAAQKSIAMFLAGIQLAITQPIRLDDVVIVENEWGRIEEITLTFVVVKIWDERRLVLPVTWFLEKPFQNWTRTSAQITGTIFIYVDYSFPVERIREVLPDMLKKNPDWDGRFWNVQVTKVTEQYKEIRLMLTSADSAKNWDLRAAIREELIDFINVNYPDVFAKIRIKKQVL